MSMLTFMPWCPIDATYDLGEMRIIPFERDKPIPNLDDAAQKQVNAILGSYKTIEGKPVDMAALVLHDTALPIKDLEQDEIEIVHELVEVACFCGLAKREYFNSLAPYCNNDSFTLYFQRFDQAEFTALSTRRREGRNLGSWPIADIAITIPVHCQPIRGVTLDEALLKALMSHRAQSQNDEWTRWQNAISCFNQANTDSDNVRYQMEWVLLCSAFEHFLKAKSNNKDVARKFTEIFVPNEDVPACNANRRLDSWTDEKQSLRHEWMSEFYKIRGDFAHGRQATQRRAVWNPLEHLVLAAIAFPLIMKSLLAKASRYTMTNDDRAQIDSFEKFADIEGFLEPPTDRKSSLDSHWKRLCDTRKSELMFKEF